MAIRVKFRCDQVAHHEDGLVAVSMYPADGIGRDPQRQVSGQVRLNFYDPEGVRPFRPGRDYWVNISAVESIE